MIWGDIMPVNTAFTSEDLFEFFNVEYDRMQEKEAEDSPEEEDLFQDDGGASEEDDETTKGASEKGDVPEDTPSDAHEKEEEEKKNISQNGFALAVQDALQQAEKKDIVETEKKSRILQDFGKKIGGARKDAAALYRKLLFDADGLSITSLTLNANWPIPKYQKLLDAGLEPWKVAAIRALRDANLSKPNIKAYGYRFRALSDAEDFWKMRLQESRGLAADILRGDVDREEFIRYLAAPHRGHFFTEEQYPEQMPEEPEKMYLWHVRYDLPPFSLESIHIPFDVDESAFFPDRIYTQIYHQFRLYEALGHDVSLKNFYVNEPIEGDKGHIYRLYEKTTQKNRWDYVGFIRRDNYYGRVGEGKSFYELVKLVSVCLEMKAEKRSSKQNTAEMSQEEKDAALFEKNKGKPSDYNIYYDRRDPTNFWVSRIVSRNLKFPMARFTLEDCPKNSRGKNDPWAYFHAHLSDWQKEFSKKVGPYLDALKHYVVRSDGAVVEGVKNSFTVYRKVSKHEVPLYHGDFKTRDDAEIYLLDHIAEIEGLFKEYNNLPFERNDVNRPRTGKKHEHGDITPEMYHKTFGFRGVEFGNWLTGKERQERLNDSYDAFLDLADVMGVDPKALSLGGTLSMRFGSNGRGGKNPAAAHFEHGYNAINLTKKNGAGCLAHEWFHAFDYYLGHKEQVEMLSDSMGRFSFDPSPVCLSEQTLSAFAGVTEVLRSDENVKLKQRSAKMDIGKSKEYWSTMCEMLARSFEVYIEKKLEDKGICNDFLVNRKTFESWGHGMEGEKGKILSETYPYLKDEEIPYVEKAFDKLVESLSTKKVNDKVEFFSCSRHDTLAAMMEESSAVPESELSDEQKAWKSFSETQLGIPLQFYDGPKELHGQFDATSDMMYLNRNSEMDYRWTFYHEAFHALKQSDGMLYRDLLQAVEDTAMITKAQMDAYRKSVHGADMSDDAVKEEMLADAFANEKTETHIVSSLANRELNLATRVMRFARRLADKAKGFFGQEKAGLTAEQATAFRERLEYITQHLQLRGKAVLSDRHQVLGMDGYPIVPEDMRFKPHCAVLFARNREKQNSFDLFAAKELLKKYTPEVVVETLKRFSPFNQTKQTARSMVLSACQRGR